MPIRVERNRSFLGWFSRVFQRTLVGRRTSPVRLFVMALLLGLPIYILLFVYIPSNGMEGGDKRNSRGLDENLEWKAVQWERPGIRAGVVGPDTDRLGRVLMKDVRVKQNNTSIDGNRTVALNGDIQTTKQTVKNINGISVLYMGCYEDVAIRARRALKGAYFADSRKMTNGRCISYCKSKSYSYAGMEFSSECYCGEAITASSAPTDSHCNMTCAADVTQICGGAPYISIYQIKRAGAPDQSEKRGDTPRFRIGGHQREDRGRSYDFRACVPVRGEEDESIFPDGIVIGQPSMSVASCANSCGHNGHPLAGMTQGTKCHCGRLTVVFNLQDAVDNSHCNTPCIGDSTANCGSQEYVSVYQTLHQDERCSNTVMMKPGTMPLIAVASFPGSGNTWVRYLIERATGIYTGSYYDDGDLYNKGFRGEREQWHKRNTVAVKTHRFDKEHISEFDGVILIIRDPYKAIMSEHNRKFGGHTGYATEKHYLQGTEWIDFVTGKSRTWTNTALNFLQYSKKLLVIHYEELKSNMKPNLEKMVRFLDQPVDNDRILCAMSSPVGRYKRPPPKGTALSFDPYTDEMKEFVTLYIKAVSMALHITNQTRLPETYNPHLAFFP